MSRLGGYYQSQNNEAAQVISYFGSHIGSVLDIGANNGFDLSNSFDLIMRGWNGYLLEPGRTCGDLFTLHKDNPKVHIFNYGISNDEGIKTFYQSGAHVKDGTDKGLVSTLDKKEMERWPDVTFETTEAQFVTFNNFWLSQDKPTFEFISIDAEGCDWEILQQINLTEVGCKCLCIEWNRNNELCNLYTAYCNKFGLKEIHRNAENLIFAL